MNIEIKNIDSNPILARIIIAGDWNGDMQTAQQLLREICNKWPKGNKVRFLITCGGFIIFEWPKDLPEIGNKKKPNPEAVKYLIIEGEKVCKLLLSGGLVDELKKITNYITLGVDSYEKYYQVQLVCLVDLRNNNYYWTGKSYPTQDEEKDLILISDLKTHFFDSNFGKIMLLGCHDLNMFNDRNWNNTGIWRKEIKERFRELTRKERPIIVLQHPHTTDHSATWRNGWCWIRENLKSVKYYAGAGKYYNYGYNCRSSLENVLMHTKSGSTIDVVVHTND